ncbi:MAG: 4'-phosphopantetheinyl transferase family protein, partial [Anaeroplasmataceae bacterium]
KYRIYNPTFIFKNNKPYLEQKDFIGRDIYFNISHSKSCVVCVVSESEIGVDVEDIKSYNDKVPKRICNENELSTIESSVNKDYELTKIWTKKESYFKYLGDTNVSFKDFDYQNVIFKSYDVDNYIITVCEGKL